MPDPKFIITALYFAYSVVYNVCDISALISLVFFASVLLDPMKRTVSKKLRRGFTKRQGIF